MRQYSLLSCAGVLLALVSHESAAVKPPRHAIYVQSTDVCSVLSNPKLFLNKEISLRGSVFVGRDGANVRDTHCPDEGIDLSVENVRYEQPDIVLFFQKVRSFGGHGVATIVGEFVATNSQLTPYSISIHKVAGVTRSAN
jgi:hypothetical protein